MKKKPEPRRAKQKPTSLTIVSGVGGLSVYLNDFRIAGEKPWGGWQIVRTFEIDAKDLEEAMKR